MAKYEFDATPFLDIIEQELTYQDHRGWDPDLIDHRSGDLFSDAEVDDDGF